MTIARARHMGRESSFGPARRVYYHRWEHGQLVHQNAKRSAHEPCHRGHRARDVLRRHQTNDANHGEAYAALAKVLNDQGKYELADKAMAKATRVYNDGLARGSLF